MGRPAVLKAPEKLTTSTTHYQLPLPVLALVGALLRLKVRRAEQMEIAFREADTHVPGTV